VDLICSAGVSSVATAAVSAVAKAGLDLAEAAQERAVLDGFASDFIASLFRGENRMFTRPEDMEHLLDGLRLASEETVRPPPASRHGCLNDRSSSIGITGRQIGNGGSPPDPAVRTGCR